jgi:hypothetical protein
MPSEEEGRSPGIGANWWAVESAVESAVERAVERAVDRANTASLEPRDPPSGELSWGRRKALDAIGCCGEEAAAAKTAEAGTTRLLIVKPAPTGSDAARCRAIRRAESKALVMDVAAATSTVRQWPNDVAALVGAERAATERGRCKLTRETPR